MGPIGLPESFLRRRSRAGSDDHAAIGELSVVYPVMIDAKGAPLSPKADTNRCLHASKSQESLCPFTNHGGSERACSRETLSSDAEGEAELADSRLVEKQSLFRDLCQTQLSLWTFTVSTLLTYFWQKRVNLRSVLFAGCALAVTVFMSGLLAAVVMAAHLFNTDFAESFGGFGDWLNDDDSKYPHLLRRQSSGHRKNSRRSSGGSGTTTPDKFQQTRLWQKNVATLERSYIASSRA